jgi:RNA polymerase sigma factor (sigma-70 family)
MPPPSDQARWFAEEVQPHDASLRFYVRGSFPSVRDVDDVVQESYLRLWQAKTRRQIGATRAFLFRVARNLAIDVLRRERVSPVVAVAAAAELEVADAHDVAEHACTRDELTMLAEAIQALPNRCRAVMVLRQLEGVSQKEIAQRLGMSELTVQTHVVHGLRKIERHLRRRGMGGTP